MTKKHQQRSRVGRPQESCSQCQRRRQKCNRQWPCTNCQSRKVAHLCDFPGQTHRKAVAEPPPNKPTSQSTQNRDCQIKGNDPSPDARKALRAIGYGDLGELNDLQRMQKAIYGRITANQERNLVVLENTWSKTPSKTLLDILVRHTLTHVLYASAILIEEKIIDECEIWWSTPKSQKSLEFSCLVFRLCALAMQCLSDNSRRNIEYELGDDVQSLTERYHEAAQQLHECSENPASGLVYVQQLSLAAAWFKGEGSFVKAWHCLATAIREAQELGFHREIEDKPVPAIEKELRRRLWCSLSVWDRHMSIMLRRPSLIDGDSCTVQLPSPSLESDVKHPDAPTPILEQIFQYKVAGVMVKIKDLKGEADTNAVTPLLIELQDLYKGAPDSLKLWSSSLILDEKRPCVDFARHRALITVYSAAFMLLKRFILAPVSTSVFPTNELQDIERLRSVACDYGIRIIELACYMASRFQERGKDHQICFYPFDTAITFCVALRQDTRKSLPMRDRVILSIGKAMRTLSGLNRSKVATEGHKILLGLQTNLSLPTQDENLLDQNRFDMPHDVLPSLDDSPMVRTCVIQATEGEDVYLDNTNIDLGAQLTDMEWRDIDLGALNDVFNWDSLYPFEPNTEGPGLEIPS